ncbi:hypothetical protein IV38_GL001070 [Lactobacillus selangorensis]|uniref:Maltose phosphorylase n=1 Tax=Lactobacillus selangorensis TaxID=81857 RepID=A0A0R2G5M6_9LACO|nr:glycoside hydrolase family 65 protein [Lactobacillus selangorensis]KRN28863.1 hypothetical protein IV38_GL001070 [Lactobacillus selangorensis]KRN32727.1 hypothetical protein IV40_GL000783 [Lactobacillus selangorensis]
MQRIFEVDPWKIVTHKLDKQNKRLQESMTSIGNEYMGMRGMFEEDYSGDTLHGLYLGGIWYPDKTVVGWWKNGYPKYFGKVINAVNFDKTNLWINNEKVDLATDQISDFELSLDMKRGILTRRFTVEKKGAKVAVTIERLVSIVDKQLFDLHYHIQNLSDQTVDIRLVSSIDADVANEDSNYDEKFWEVLAKQTNRDSAELFAKTKPNQFDVPRFTVGVGITHHTTMEAGMAPETDQSVSNAFVQTLAAQQSLNFEKRAVVVTSRDYDSFDDLRNGLHQLTRKLDAKSHDQIIQEQADAWQARWDKSDVVIDGDVAAQQGIRFNLFQLFSTFYGDDKRLNIGPKGFTGEKYGGATYWDTEAFGLPFYLSLADQKVARNLLEYRYNQLPEAFHNAHQQGLKGALYPMVTFNGIENHNEWEITFEEIHRNGTIAYAIYNYTRYTGDDSYLKEKGIDVLTAISRFWADRVEWSEHRQHYVIHGVTGPNEYENNINDNWYTNLLARWTLKYTLENLPKVSPEKQHDLDVTEDEKKQWQDIIDKLLLPEDKERGIFLQQDGFLDKNLQPASSIPADQRPINQHWSWDHILRSPYIKQADVLQGIWYFITEFTPEQKKRNFDFYEPLTVHESSLSPSVHAILAADLHYEDKAVEMYERTARLDLDNYNNDTVDGLHITSMTGSWLAIVQGFAGMRIENDQLTFKPFLPKKWTRYQFHINFRGRLLVVTVDQNGTQIKLLKGAPLTIQLNDKPVTLEKQS